MNTKRVGLVLVWLILIPGAVRADGVDDYLRGELAKRQIPGLALAVVKNGQTIKAAGYGIANLETGTPVTPESMFELASITKQFTAACVLLLVEEGKVRLDDPISQHLPNTPQTWQAITVRHLLTHTSGLPALENGFKSLVRTFNLTTAQMYEAARQDRLDFGPGERWQYSDVGYFLLGMLIEKASGKKYAEFLAERIFRPLGMNDSRVLDQWEIIKNRARGYTLYNGKLVNIRRDWQVELPSHFGVLSTVLDLAKWDAALYTDRILQQASREQMATPVKLNHGGSYPYGFGWWVDEKRGHRFLSHTGITGTEFTRYLDDGLTVIVLTNLGRGLGPETASVNSWGLTHAVAGRYLPELLVSRLPAQPDPDPKRTAMLKQVLADVANGVQDSPRMTPGMRTATSPGWGPRFAHWLRGEKSFTFIQCEEVGQRGLERNGGQVRHICYYQMVTGPSTLYWRFYLTADGHVTHLWPDQE